MSKIFVTEGPCHMDQIVHMNKHRVAVRGGGGESWKSNQKTAKMTL